MHDEMKESEIVASPTNLWSCLTDWEVSLLFGVNDLYRQNHCLIYEFHINRIYELLEQAGDNEEKGISIMLPGPTSIPTEFLIWRSISIADFMRKRFKGYAVDNVSAQICLDVSKNGLHAKVTSPKCTWSISPVDKKNHLYFVYKNRA